MTHYPKNSISTYTLALRIEFNYSLALAGPSSGGVKRVLTDTFAVFQGYKPTPEDK